jgi:hypothetical protein
MEDEDEMMALLRQQRLLASSNDPDNTQVLNATFISSLNDHAARAGNIEDVIALSIHDKDRPLVDLKREDDEAGPSGVVKDEPTDVPANLRSKPPADEDYNFFQYYGHSSSRRCH